MDEGFIPIIIVSAIIIIAIISYFFSTKQQILRALKKTKATSIQRAKESDYVKIIGKAREVKDVMYSPITNRKCIFYQIIVEQKGSKNSWRTIISDIKTTDFFIEHQGEMAIVKLNGPSNFNKIFLEKDRKKKSGTFNDADDRMKLYLKSQGRESTNLLGFNKNLRYHEGIIEINETIAVKGVANWKILKEVIPDYNYSKVLTLKGTKEQKLLVTDLQKALTTSNS